MSLWRGGLYELYLYIYLPNTKQRVVLLSKIMKYWRSHKKSKTYNATFYFQNYDKLTKKGWVVSGCSRYFKAAGGRGSASGGELTRGCPRGCTLSLLYSRTLATTMLVVNTQTPATQTHWSMWMIRSGSSREVFNRWVSSSSNSIISNKHKRGNFLK